MRKLLLFNAFVLLWAMNSLFAQNVYNVATTGNDANTGLSAEQSLATIQAAIDLAVDGDQVLVASGTYIENVDFKGKKITVKSSDGVAVTTLQPLSIYQPLVKFVTNESRDSKLIGFTLEGPGRGTGIEITVGAYPYIQQCVVKKFQKGVRFNGTSGLGGRFDNCLITGNNLAFEIKDWQVKGKLVHCTIAENVLLGLTNGYFDGYNCIILSTDLYQESYLSGNYHKCITNMEYNQLESFNADPLLLPDFSLGIYSPAIGAATDQGYVEVAENIEDFYLKEDLFGNVRSYVGVSPDLGAIENTLDASQTPPTIIYVAPNGDDLSEGTQENPLASIQTAVNIATDATDKIVLETGTYKERVVIEKNVHIQGSEGVVIDMETEDGRIFDIKSGNVIIENMSLLNAGLDGGATAGHAVYAKTEDIGTYQIQLKNLIIDKNAGWENGAGIHISGFDAVVKACEITNGSEGQGTGVYLKNTNAVINNCLIAGNSSSSFAAGIYMDQNANVDINYCTITNNELRSVDGSYQPGAGIYYSDGFSQVNITNSIISGNKWIGAVYEPGDIALSEAGQFTVSNSLIGKGWIGETEVEGAWEGDNNLNVDPLFINPKAGNYQIGSFSPCIGAGKVIAGITSDIEGNARPDVNPDMGAYESALDVALTIPSVIYVSPAGDNANNGTVDKPLASVQYAVSLAGETTEKVVLKPGTYTEALEIDKSVVITSDAAANQVIFDGTTLPSYMIQINGDYGNPIDVTLENFSLINAPYYGINVYSLNPPEKYVANVKLNNMILKDGKNWAINAVCTDLLVMNSLIHSNRGAIMANQSKLTINYSTITGNDSEYIDNYESTGGVYLSGETEAIITNSILWNNKCADQVYDITCGSIKPISIDKGSLISGIRGTEVQYTNLDPKFTDAANNDFSLQKSSPAIGAGTLTNAPVVDVFGNSRPNPNGSMPDVGAVESERAKPYLSATIKINPLGCAAEEGFNVQLNILNGTAPYTVSVEGPNGFTSSETELKNLEVGNYTYTISDVNNEIIQGSFELSPELFIYVEAEITPVSCSDFSGGAITPIIYNSTMGEVWYRWFYPNGEEVIAWEIADLDAGDYKFSISSIYTDCAYEYTFTVGVESEIADFALNGEGDFNYCGDEVINTVIEPTAGMDSYKWSKIDETSNWSTVSTANMYTLSETGTYKLQVKHQGSCAVETFVVTQAEYVQPSFTLESEQACESTNAMVDYQWEFVSYKWYNNAQTESISITESADVFVTGITEDGCEYESEHKTVTIDEPIENFSIVADGPTEFCPGESVTLSANQEFEHYNWIYEGEGQQSETQSFTASNDGVYILQVANGACSIQAMIEINVFEPYTGQQICMVSVDEESGKNMLVYNKTEGERIDLYNFYKETGDNAYTLIGGNYTTDANYFVDQESNPVVSSERYKISVTDECASESDLQYSTAHKTIYLAANIGVNGNVNLQWQPYEGFDVAQIRVLRGSALDNLQEIAVRPANNTNYTDVEPVQEENIYVIEAVNTGACSIENGGSTKAAMAQLGARSNPAVASGTSVTEYLMENVNIFPNPANDKFTIQLPENYQEIEVVIVDLAGSVVYSESFANQNQVNIENAELKSGMYFVSILVDTQKTIKKIQIR